MKALVWKYHFLPSASDSTALWYWKHFHLIKHFLKVYLSPLSVTILDPTQVDATKTVSGDACKPVVIILVDVGIKGGIQVHIVPLSTSSQALFHGLISQPLFKLRGSDDVVDDTLNPERAQKLRSFQNVSYSEMFLNIMRGEQTLT